MTIEQKAKAYDEAIKRANELLYVSNKESLQYKTIERILPELVESDDEKIRKDMIETIKKESKDFPSSVIAEKSSTWIAWLEKQGEQNNNEDADILYRFSFYSYKDEPNVIYLSGFYVNEECRNKGIGTKILEVADEVTKSLDCHAIRLKTKKDSDAERLYQTHGYNSLLTEGKDEIWLEKQAEQNTVVIIPKFKVGDWIITNKNHIWYVDETPETTSYLYRLINQYGKVEVAEFEVVDNVARLWTIQDAKDGDVLRIRNLTFIFQEITNNNACHKDAVVAYCSYEDNDDGFNVCGPDCITDLEIITPATKEQRDALERAITNAGYR